MKLRVLGGVLAGILALLAATGCDDAAATVVILTEPSHADLPVGFDLNEDGAIDQDEILFYYDIFDWNEELTFIWPADFHEAQVDEKMSYQVALYQLDGDVLSDNPEALNWRVIKAAHHWASNPNGRQFTMGSFGFGEELCFDCLSFILVLPERVDQVYNEATGAYEYEYTLFEDSEGFWSVLFTFEQTPRG